MDLKFSFELRRRSTCQLWRGANHLKTGGRISSDLHLKSDTPIIIVRHDRYFRSAPRIAAGLTSIIHERQSPTSRQGKRDCNKNSEFHDRLRFKRGNSRASDSPCVSYRLDRSQGITAIDAVVQRKAPDKCAHWRLAPTFDVLPVGSAAISKNALRQISGNQNNIGIAGLISPPHVNDGRAICFSKYSFGYRSRGGSLLRPVRLGRPRNARTAVDLVIEFAPFAMLT
jgi:hypothetical protein